MEYQKFFSFFPNCKKISNIKKNKHNVFGKCLKSSFTLLIGVIYPMHCSVRQLIKKNRKEMRKWLEYWIVFFLFINFETLFSNFLEKINMYLFYKVVFLSICFLPSYNASHLFIILFLKRMALFL